MDLNSTHAIQDNTGLSSGLERRFPTAQARRENCRREEDEESTNGIRLRVQVSAQKVQTAIIQQLS